MTTRGALLILVAVLALVAPALASDADLDPTWGNDGVTVAVVTDGNEQLLWADLSSALDVRGTLWVTGASAGGPSRVLRNKRAQDPGPFLIRFRSDGKLDRRLSRTGIIRRTQAPWLRRYGSGALDVALANGGMVGRATGVGATGLVRGRPNATLDTSFGRDRVQERGCVRRLDPLIRTSDGGFAALTWTCRAQRKNAGTVFEVMRFTARGRIDRSFGHAGTARVRLSARHPIVDGLPQILALPQGAVAVADAAPSADGGDLVIVKLTRAGRLDRGFGVGGVARVASINPDRVAFGGAAVLPGGAIVVDGCSGDDGSLYRVLPNGTRDTAWHEDGVTPIGTAFSALCPG